MKYAKMKMKTKLKPGDVVVIEWNDNFYLGVVYSIYSYTLCIQYDWNYFYVAEDYSKITKIGEL